MRNSGAVLALDVGTSSCRASLYDLQGRRMSHRAGQVSYQATTTIDGGAQLDPERLFYQVCAAVDEVLEGESTPIVGVATSTFWHSLMGVDADGSPLTPLFLWLDARSRDDLPRLRSTLDEHAAHARTGCVLHWSYWPAKLAWLRRTQPAIAQHVHRWVSFGEFAYQRLTGEQAVSVSMASGTGLFDQHTIDWDPELLTALQVRPSDLSPILDGSASGAPARSDFSSRWPALRNVPWLAPVGDGACSNIGAGCTTPERFALMVGTSGAERAVWSPPGPFEIPRGAWCYRVDRARVVLGGALNDGGSLLDWLRRSLRLPSVAASETELCAMAPDSHGLTVLPLWGGERSPGWADDARGSVVGLRLHTRPVDILHAALEGVALRFGEIDRRLREAMPGRDRGEVIATGGALLHSPAWMQILADVLGRPVVASLEREGSSRGAALLGLEALGHLAGPLETLPAPVGRRFEPNPDHVDLYRAAAARQRRLYDALVSHGPT